MYRLARYTLLIFLNVSYFLIIRADNAVLCRKLLLRATIYYIVETSKVYDTREWYSGSMLLEVDR